MSADEKMESLKDRLAASTALGPPIRTSRAGPIPGQAIINSPHRAEIDTLLFVRRVSVEQVRRICAERFGLTISRKQLDNYIKFQRETGLTEIARLPDSIVLDNVEKSVRRDMEVLDKIVGEADRVLATGKVTVRSIIDAIKVRNEMLGEHNAIQLLTAEEKYRLAMQSVLSVINDLVDEDTKLKIQAKLLLDPHFVAAMNVSLDAIEGEAEEIVLDASS